MEVAGIALGALPIALYAVDNYHRCLKPARNYFDYKHTLEDIRRNLFVQQQQLQVTLEDAGLPCSAPEETQDRLRDMYPDSAARFIDVLAHMDTLLLKVMDKLDIDMKGKVRNTVIQNT
jgi:hypothetical protein